MLKKGSGLAYYQVFLGIRFGSILLTGILLARLLQPEDLSSWENAFLWMNVLTFFWVTALGESLINHESILRIDELKIAFNRVSILAFCFSIVSGIVATISLFYDYSAHEESSKFSLILFFLPYILFFQPSLLIESYYLKNNEYKTLFITGSITYALFFICSILPVLLGLSLKISALLLGLLGLVRMGLAFSIFSLKSCKNDFKYITNTFILILPLIGIYLVAGASEQTGGMLASLLGDERAFVFFRYGSKELPLSLILANSISGIFSAKISSSLNNQKTKYIIYKELKQNILKIQNILFPVTILLLIFSKYIFEFVFGYAYIQASIIFDIFLFLLLSRVLFPQTILKGLGHTKSLFTISIIEAFVNLGLGLILFMLFGIQGIAWSVVIAFFVEKVLLIALLFKKEGIKPWVYIPVPSTIIYSIILISVFIIKTSIF